ncbi:MULTISPECIES: DUF167 family protein [Thalassospira]|jgi:uncharacterized protein (TIGR00251 family)|uniref:DUF167 family protein n=1 Tax=Thalassospira TaxID=168934 RepID=UPI000C533B87|nr:MULTISPECIES: DUF167 family protein [Thalassospira]MAL40781.1 hypothetical protein [Thalassospira sp.]MCC4241767.1 DUF167 family protein [Thalassospira povalilytica]URK16173.1 DUF167 family protein [Thalassospira sp. GO-4]HAY49729.1 hypothetical protein [Thalassospira sp.]|tara:strand:+ start:666 stop:1001 length:336 start_codon:yes stop_codon:yes gene_type:complete
MTDPVCEILSDQTGIRLFVRLTPKASRNAINGLIEDANGRLQLRASVTAVPENGKANQALIKLLAKAAKWPKSSVGIVSGHTDRNKVLVISGTPTELMAQITELTGGQTHE